MSTGLQVWLVIVLGTTCGASITTALVVGQIYDILRSTTDEPTGGEDG